MSTLINRKWLVSLIPVSGQWVEWNWCERCKAHVFAFHHS
jgi:hypothetical protein